MGNAPAHTPNRAFKLPIVFPNKRNLFGVLSLSPFQHEQLKTGPCVFSVLCSPAGCDSRHKSHPRMAQVGRDHLPHHPCSLGAIPEHRRCWGMPVELPRVRTAKTSSTSSVCPTRAHKAGADGLGGSWFHGDSLAVGQRAQALPRHAGSSVPSCEFPGPGQHRV